MPQKENTIVENITPEQQAALDKAKADAALLLKQAEEAKAKAARVTFGDGRYSNAMGELYKDSQRLLTLTPKQAEKLARSYGSELGRLNMTNKIQFGRVTKNQQVTIREVASIKGVTMTHALNLAKACVILQDALSFGIESIVEVKIKANVLEWLNE